MYTSAQQHHAAIMLYMVCPYVRIPSNSATTLLGHTEPGSGDATTKDHIRELPWRVVARVFVCPSGG